jgi:iron complex transport system substrate-binding protein
MLSRRSFLRGSIAAASLTGLARLDGLAQTGGGQARPKRVFAAGPPAAVLVYVLSPSALVGWPSKLDEAAVAMLGSAAKDLPVVGRLSGRGSTVSLESLVQLKPDLVLDVGSIDATRTSMAERVRSQTGLPYELLDGRLADSGALLRRAGGLLHLPERAEQLARVADRLVASLASGRARRSTTRIYLARGIDGLETGLGGSINVEVVEFVGAQNVAAAAGTGSLTRVSLEQVLAWDPDVILTQEPAFAETALTDPAWRKTRAARERRVWLAPALPFGWLDGPPGVNRLIGALWLARRLDGTPVATIRDEVHAFYDTFYGVQLSAADLDRLLAEAA